MQGKLTNVQEKKEIEDIWQAITFTMKQAIKTVQTERRTRRCEEWFDKECEREIAKRKKLRLEMLEVDTEKCKNVRKYVEKKRENATRKLSVKLKTTISTRKSETSIKGQKNEKKDTSRAILYKNKKGELIAEKYKTLETQAKYFQHLLRNYEEQKETNEDNEQTPSLEEIAKVFRNLEKQQERLEE